MDRARRRSRKRGRNPADGEVGRGGAWRAETDAGRGGGAADRAGGGAGRQVGLAPGADPRRAGGRRDADHRAARRAGRARHRPGDAGLRRHGRADRARAPGGSQGVGVGGFQEPEDVIDHGNSGTGVRLVMGAMATTDITATFTGDASLRGRPMGRITEPLALFGAEARGPARRAAADHADRRGEPDAGAVHDAGALGAGEVGGAARRAERARRDGGDREGADARPYRADAARLRRRRCAPSRRRRGG